MLSYSQAAEKTLFTYCIRSINLLGNKGRNATYKSQYTVVIVQDNYACIWKRSDYMQKSTVSFNTAVDRAGSKIFALRPRVITT